MRRAATVIATAGAVLAGAAGAAPADPVQEARRLIDQARAGDVFTIAAYGRSPAARHAASGLVCQFHAGSAANRIMVYPTAALPRGDDVGCDTEIDGTRINYSVTRYAAPKSKGQALAEAVADLKSQFDEVRYYREWRGPEGPWDPGTPDSHTQRFLASYMGRRILVRISAARVKGWIVVQRATAPYQNLFQITVAADQPAETGWKLVLTRMIGIRSKSEALADR